ncbi:MAG: hypothetical protein AB7I18_10655 [Candidatus Berkiella sp.]
MRKGLLGVIVGVGLMFAQSAGAADMVRYDKAANKTQPEENIAQIQMDGSCKPHCRPCPRQCPPKHYRKRCHSQKGHHHSGKKHQQAVQRHGHNEALEEKKMSSEGGFGRARKTSYEGNSGRQESFVEEYIDEVGREHR